MGLKDPKEVADSLVDGALSAVQFFPRVAENVSKVANDYSASVTRDLEEIKMRMPEDIGTIPRVALGAIGKTAGAGIGLIEAFTDAGSKTFADIKGQIRRTTG